MNKFDRSHLTKMHDIRQIDGVWQRKLHGQTDTDKNWLPLKISYFANPTITDVLGRATPNQSPHKLEWAAA
mgnify:CR=1 FL=1